MKKFGMLLLLLLLSCQHNQSKSSVNIYSIPQANKRDKSLPELLESFTDSINIGQKSFNKLELKRYRSADSSYVLIKFYSKKNNKWVVKNVFRYDKDLVSDCDTQISDFNNDGFKDMTYVSAIGARGANEIRRLFIYDNKNDQLISITNSEMYPNMRYNNKLNCIDAFLVYGGCSTVFLKLSGDSLKEFANVELFDGLTVTTYDKNGKEKVILRDKSNKHKDVRYNNFDPLKAYPDSGE